MPGGLGSCAACLRRAAQASSRGKATSIWTGPGILPALPLRAARRYASVADAPRSLALEPVASDVSRKKDQERLERIVKKQLEHMADPWKIAQYVEDALAKDRFDEALLLTKTAGRDGQVVVAWNHLINHLLGKQQLRNAIKLYNDMKKRGQLPNVQTFTVIFRGCAQSQHPKIAVAEAVKHYNILLNDKRLQPNSIHMNAVLNVCARAGDLDSMFLVAATANDSTRAPTSYTYTTIFNALRHQALGDADDVAPEQQAANVQKAVDRAKSIWVEVIDKWRKAQLVMDEELVCSMGRVLLLAPKREDKREVLDLLQQAMSIPNLAKDSGMDAFQDSQMDKIAVAGTPKKVPSTRAVYAVPGRNTLALVLTVLASSRLTTCGIKYWNLLVRHYGIIPDNDNWLRMLGMLKVAKASAHASSVLSLMPDGYVDAKHYRIAMETCVRDNINPNAVANANRVLDSMLARLSVPDLHALRLYLRVALVSHSQFRERVKKGDRDGAKRDYGLQITTALAHLWEPYKKAHYYFFKERRSSSSNASNSKNTSNSNNDDDSSPGPLYNNQREVIALARLMFSAFNKVINEKMLPESDAKELRSVGAKINREIQKFYSDRDDKEPNLRRSRRNGAAGVKNAKGPVDMFMREEDGSVVSDEGKLDAEYRPGRDFVWNTTKQAQMEEERRPRNSWDAGRR
ncbi:dna-directed dna polymerase [Trichoderma cornu-damae]|uniref:Dna-directed dna polymerase n=1 Tax=Trichoderma cornu-damae TaxID=654480 RepID=A0A9P8QJT7_9HYPO|nr:dna-directed dna polymerase [Trichoderma cornu-damae]